MTIRSFVIREGRMTDAQRRAIAEQWEHFGLKIAEGPLDIAQVFGRDVPCTLEIGFGNGEALKDMALAEPDTNFIGIEVHRPGVGNLLKRVAEHEITNVRIYAEDAVVVLREALQPQSLARVNIYFPDPWPKKRHHKRRLIQAPFLELLASRMAPGALLHLATDWEPYADHMLETLNANPFFDNTVSGDTLDLGCVPRPESRPLTKFEARGHRKGHGVWDLIFTRNAHGV